METEMKWMDQFIEEIKNNGPSIYDDEKEQWRKHSIYKIPSQLTDLSEKAYKPRTISFGPYHYGEEKLKAMEEHKHRALVRYLKRCNNCIKFIFKRMYLVAEELKDSYMPLDTYWINNTPKFLQMMILDGCFILEILRVSYSKTPVDDYDENDIVFGKHGKLHVMPHVKRDMLMLENQIPMIVLHTLSEVAGEVDHHELNKKIINLLNPIFLEDTSSKQKIIELEKCVHVLDLCRTSLIHDKPSRQTPLPKHAKTFACLEKGGEDYFIRSAVKLQEAGVSFKKSKTRSLRDISFDKGRLWLPALNLDKGTEYMFLNLVAFERLHVGIGSEVTSFILLMDTIVDSAMDFSILNQRKILTSALGRDEVVAELFNSMAKEISIESSGQLENVRRSMNHYCRKPWKRYRASLIQTYFRNPWAMVSLVAAIFLFALTIIQTIYTILSFYHC